MADGNTTTATPSEGGEGASERDSKVERGSEFALPTGVKDAEIWDKHFGKGAEKPSKKASSGDSSKKDSAGKKPQDAPSRGASKTATKDSADPGSRTSSKPPATEAKSKEERPTKGSGTSSKEASSDSAESSDEDSDPEAPSKKAKDLYAAAKKAEDPKEARRLYKRAMKEAFGEIPEEFDDGRYAAVRQERKAARAALDEQAQKNEGRIREAAEKLKPAIYVMRQLEGAGIADRLTVPLVEKAITVIRALGDLENGDYTKLADVISKATGVDPDEAMKRFVRGVKVSPEGKAARAAAEEANRRAAAAEQRMQELERRLTERDTAQTEAQKRAEREQQVAQARADYLESIESELEGHPVLKLKDGSKRVMRYIIRTADKKLRAPKYSFTQAADRILRAERARINESRAVLDADGEEVEASKPAREPMSRVVHIPRSARAEAGVADTSPEASFNRIFDKHQGTGGRRR